MTPVNQITQSRTQPMKHFRPSANDGLARLPDDDQATALWRDPSNAQLAAVVAASGHTIIRIGTDHAVRTGYAGAEDAPRRHAERQALMLRITSDLIRASELGELGRMTFEHISSALGAVVCTNYRLDPAGRRLRLEYARGVPSEHLEAARSLELGQEYCGTAAASCEPLVADKQRIASDPNGGLVRELGATAYACYPLKASNGRLLGTFAVASATRESFTDDEVIWLGTITNFLAQAWERFEAEQSLSASEERLRLSQEAAGLGHWDYDYVSGTLVWSEQTRKLLGVEPGEPAS